MKRGIWYLINIVIICFVLSCGDPKYQEFQLGEIVCHKGGGPKGVISSYCMVFDEINVPVWVTFYKKQSTNDNDNVQREMGYFFTNNGITNTPILYRRRSSRLYSRELFHPYELLHERDCKDR